MDRTSLYKEFFQPNLVLLTCRTVNHEPVLGSSEMVHLLRSILRELKPIHPFRLAAYAFLPTHIHLLVGLDGETQPSQLIRELSSHYDSAYQSLMGNPHKMTVWQKQAEQRPINDVDTFAACLDAIHYDPVRHGLTTRPEEWPDTSYEAWVERSVYKLGWGWEEPQSIRDFKID